MTTEASLSSLLEAIAAKQAEKAELDASLKKVNADLRQMEGLAVEQLAAAGLDGVRAAGKSWGTREFFSVSVPKEHRKAVVEAARAAGLGDLVSVNTSTLKTWLLENRDEEADAEAGIAAGTAFDGLVSEYREVRLSHRTVG